MAVDQTVVVTTRAKSNSSCAKSSRCVETSSSSVGIPFSSSSSTKDISSSSVLTSTQVKCAALFTDLSDGKLPRKWAEFYSSKFCLLESQYGSGRDGWPAVMASRAANGQAMTCLYRWALPSQQTGPADRTCHTEPLVLRSRDFRPINWPKVKGVYFWLHGLTEHVRLELLAFDKHSMKYEGSFLESLQKSSLVVYGFDYQGHGLSEGFNGEKLSVTSVDDLIADAAWWIDTIIELEKVPEHVPIFVGGISLGGMLAIASLKHMKRKDRIKALTLLAPAVSLEKSRRDVSPLLFNIAPLVVRFFPNWRFIKLKTGGLFPELTERLEGDALLYTGGRVPIKFALELYLSRETVREVVGEEQKARLLVIQSARDTLVDPEGAEWLRQNWKGAAATVVIMQERGWHLIVHEPDCCAWVRQQVLQFLKKHIM